MHQLRHSAARWGTAFLLVLALAPCVFALSVQPPTFSELVDKAETIVRARVIAVKARPAQQADGRATIRTFITFQVLDALKGAPAGTVEVSALGGRIGLEGLAIPGLPEFKVGEEGYYFLNGRPAGLFPLVAVGHGRYRIQPHPAGGERVLRDNYEPLHAAEQVALPLMQNVNPLSLAQVPMTPADFEKAVRAELARSVGAKEVQP